MARRMKAVKCPNEELSLTNCAVVSEKDFDVNKSRHLEVITAPNHHYVFSIKAHSSISPGTMGFSAPQRKWALLSLGQEVDVRPYNFNATTDYISHILLEVDFFSKKNVSTEPYDTDKMALEFLMQFPHQAFSVGQELVFNFTDKKMLTAQIKELEGVNTRTQEISKINIGLCMPNTTLCFEKKPNSLINLIGKSRGKQEFQSIISSSWNFEQMGIGGLNTEVSTIFRRAFSSRILPMHIFEELGVKHCKGVLLFGPPGTGKTLIARQLGKMLNARPPKIVSGPEILDKYVGESEANIRKLFADAEEEEKRMGPNSGLHIIIFDEIDAICKARGTVSGGTGVNDSIVNQLLAKMDGVDQLNNIIVIGMTNRRDMIDEALMRPGRLEVQVEIGLPNKEGRLEILKIHTAKMREFGRLASDVNLEELATLTKNFSGAELEGLVRAAISKAIFGLVKDTGKIEVDLSEAHEIKVDMTMFRLALAQDIKPAFGMNEEILKVKQRGIINWGKPISTILEEGDNLIKLIKFGENTELLSVLFEGAPGSGKTALAATLATKSEFPFLRMSSTTARIGKSESARVEAIKKMFDDAYKSPLSCIILDDLEGIMGYSPIGLRYSTMMFEALRILIAEPPPTGHRLLLIATSSCRELLQEFKLLSFFDRIVHVFNISNADHLVSALEEMGIFTQKELEIISKKITGRRLSIGIKKLMKIADDIRLIEEDYRIPKFLSILERDGYLD